MPAWAVRDVVEQLLETHDPGEVVPLVAIREGERGDLEVELDERPA